MNTQETVLQEAKNLIEKSFLQEYLQDEHITDISFNSKNLFIQHNVKGRYLAEEQPTAQMVSQLGKNLADLQNKEWNLSKPVLDTEIEYLRANFVHSEVSPFGVTFSLRVSRPRKAIMDLSELANDDVAKLMETLVAAEYSIVISGKTGSGKTELQKRLAGFISKDKKITLIEDTMDSHLKLLYPEHDINSWRVLLNREKNPVTWRDLIKAGLRNNPDFLIISETRGDEAYDMLQASMTDHAVLTTLHATGATSIPSRLLSMIGQTYNINETRLGKDIVQHLKIGIHMGTKFDKEKGVIRYIREIVEFTDFTETGEANYNILYKLNKTYNQEDQLYKENVETNPLSENSLQKLKNLEVFHMLPDVFSNSK